MNKRTKTEINVSPPAMEGIDINQLMKISKDDTHILRIRKKKIKTTLPNDKFLYLPTRFEKIGNQNPLAVFEAKYCQCRLVHSDEIYKPVLQKTLANDPNDQPNLNKLCIQSFKLIISCEANLKNCKQLCDLINSSPNILIDDVFAQVLMQSTQAESKIWELFLVICTLYVPSKEILPYLKSYFSVVANT